MGKHITVRLDDNLAEKMAERAGGEGLTVSGLIRKAVLNYLLIDPVLMNKSRRLAVGLGVTSIEVVANLATGRLAQMEAEREVWGPSGELMEEFYTLDGETPDGQTLFDMLKSMHLHKEKLRKQDIDERF